MTGDALNVVLAVATLVVSTAIGYYFFVRAQRDPRPVYAVRGNAVVRAQAERKIEVRFRGTEVPVVTRTVVAFWNAGRQPIRGADLAETHPLTINLPSGVRVLEMRVLAQTRPDIDFVIYPEFPSVKPQLGFSFLNYRDGATVELLHTRRRRLERER